MTHPRRLVAALLVLMVLGSTALLATFTAITGSGVGGAFVSGDQWTATIAEHVRQDLNDLNTRLAAVEAAYITAISSTTLTNKTLDAEGTGNVITIPFRTAYPGAICQNATAITDWSLPVSNPAAAACVTGTNVQKGTLDFADGASSLSAQRTLRLPADWTGALDAVITWYSSGTSGNVVWQVATICAADAVVDDPAFNTASTVTDAVKGTTLQLNDAAITGITATGCTAGSVLHVKLFRDPANVSDTLAATAKVVTFELTVRRAM